MFLDKCPGGLWSLIHTSSLHTSDAFGVLSQLSGCLGNIARELLDWRLGHWGLGHRWLL